MPQQSTSLLSLPDELLIQTFDYLADQPMEVIHPLWPLTHVCRGIREVAQTVLYRDVVLDPGDHVTRRFGATVKQNPSLGQFASSLFMYDPVPHRYFDKSGVLGREVQAALRTLTKLKDLSLWEVTPNKAASILAALPSPSLRSLDINILWTGNPSHWRDLQTQLSRFSQLHDLSVINLNVGKSSPRLPHAPRATRRSR